MAQSGSTTESGKSTTRATDDNETTSDKTESDASIVRRTSQEEEDRVAMVSRTKDGEADQSKNHEVIGLSENASEKEKAAAENRPEKS